MKELFIRIFFKRREKYWWINLLIPIISVILALISGAIFIRATGRSPLLAYKYLFGASGFFPNHLWKIHFAEMPLYSSMFISTGLAFAIAAKGGLFNIGAEGQFIMGGIVAVYFGYARPFAGMPTFLHLTIIFIMVMIVGGGWGAIAGYLRAKKGIHEVITTIMLNWIALYLIQAWLVTGPMQAKESGTGIVTGTPYISQTARLPKILPGTRLNISIIIIIIVTYLIWYLFYRTTLGYEIRAIGHTLIFDMETPKASGVDVDKRIIQTMFISGAVAALGGGFMFSGILFKYPPVFKCGFGFDGIAVALIGQNEPIGVFLAGIFIGALRAGATSVQLAHIPKSFPSILEGLTVAFIALRELIRYWLIKLVQSQKSAPVEAERNAK